MSLLVLTNITKKFAGQTILSQVSFTMQAGESYCIYGPKGSGKSTLLNIICGIEQPSSGQILFRDQNLQGRPLNQYAQLGIARTFSSPQNYPNLSVLENVLIGTHSRGTWNMTGALHGLFAPCVKREETALKELALACISRVGLQKEINQVAGNLSPFDRKKLELGRAIASQPILLLLDQPFTGLREEQCKFVAELLSDLNSSGTNIILTAEDRLQSDLCSHYFSLSEIK